MQRLCNLLCLSVLFVTSRSFTCNAFTTNSNSNQGINHIIQPQIVSPYSSSSSSSMRLMASLQNNDDDISTSRRQLFKQIATSSLFAIGATGVGTIGIGANIGVQNANAASAPTEPTIWKSGKQPIVPGKKPKDKNDTSGTRKDGDFLRSISNCKNQCENTYGPDGYARSKEECLSDCQDICCKTYEQCTFGIVPRI
jgi:hypothetical protein